MHDWARKADRPALAWAFSVAGFRSFSSQLSKSPGESATTRMSMLACWVPQYSAHCPRYSPGLSVWNHMELTRPGITSVLPASRGTQKLRHTSADLKVRYTEPA